MRSPLLVLDPIHVRRANEVGEPFQGRRVPRSGDPDAVVASFEGNHRAISVDAGAVIGNITAGGIAKDYPPRLARLVPRPRSAARIQGCPEDALCAHPSDARASSSSAARWTQASARTFGAARRGRRLVPPVVTPCRSRPSGPSVITLHEKLLPTSDGGRETSASNTMPPSPQTRSFIGTSVHSSERLPALSQLPHRRTLWNSFRRMPVS